ncbi:hypothetical protein [Sphingomonas sp. HMP6]|uniref:hypothetical protein n=1 Tax=Sphingomonas sp. HMP6 TaxID=1517551 RepID=UPI00159641FC|nr:hypothetical protein [Sphingomonas sp. HMP6]BCA60465.1 hypothetical protein HMP06_3234 [Sphingomonas sp. HMP6]
MSKHNMAQRRYLARFFPAMVGYVVLLFASTYVIRFWHPSGVTLAALAVAPSLPLLAVIGVMGLYLLEERDEFLRQRLVTAMLGGLAVLLAVLTVWGFLANGGVAEEPPAFLAFPLWCGAFGLVQCGLNVRDRMSSGAAA